MTTMPPNPDLLSVRGLRVDFRSGAGATQAVKGVSFDIQKGETVALVGESGSGKSVTALSILQLLPYPMAHHPAGSIRFRDTELLGADERTLRQVRGNRIAMIFQEPMTSLNPLHSIERQINETLFLHKRLSTAAARARTLELLRLVGLPDPEKRLTAYPHELSGGQRQRVMIAMALANEPDLLIADEPTTALDVTIQAQILRLMRQLTHDFNTSVILITHDMGVVAEMADHVMVMYAGKDVEYGTLEQIFDHPLHPYTNGLLRSIPRINQRKDERLYTIDGTVPTLDEMPKGCRFCTRCKEATQRCWEQDPGMHTLADGHKVRCWKYVEEGGSTDGSSAAGNP